MKCVQNLTSGTLVNKDLLLSQYFENEKTFRNPKQRRKYFVYVFVSDLIYKITVQNLPFF